MAVQILEESIADRGGYEWQVRQGVTKFVLDWQWRQRAWIIVRVVSYGDCVVTRRNPAAAASGRKGVCSNMDLGLK